MMALRYLGKKDIVVRTKNDDEGKEKKKKLKEEWQSGRRR